MRSRKQLLKLKEARAQRLADRNRELGLEENEEQLEPLDAAIKKGMKMPKGFKQSKPIPIPTENFHQKPQARKSTPTFFISDSGAHLIEATTAEDPFPISEEAKVALEEGRGAEFVNRMRINLSCK